MKNLKTPITNSCHFFIILLFFNIIRPLKIIIDIENPQTPTPEIFVPLLDIIHFPTNILSDFDLKLTTFEIEIKTYKKDLTIDSSLKFYKDTNFSSNSPSQAIDCEKIAHQGWFSPIRATFGYYSHTFKCTFIPSEALTEFTRIILKISNPENATFFKQLKIPITTTFNFPNALAPLCFFPIFQAYFFMHNEIFALKFYFPLNVEYPFAFTRHSDNLIKNILKYILLEEFKNKLKRSKHEIISLTQPGTLKISSRLENYFNTLLKTQVLRFKYIMNKADWDTSINDSKTERAELLIFFRGPKVSTKKYFLPLLRNDKIKYKFLTEYPTVFSLKSEIVRTESTETSKLPLFTEIKPVKSRNIKPKFLWDLNKFTFEEFFGDKLFINTFDSLLYERKSYLDFCFILFLGYSTDSENLNQIPEIKTFKLHITNSWNQKLNFEYSNFDFDFANSAQLTKKDLNKKFSINMSKDLEFYYTNFEFLLKLNDISKESFINTIKSSILNFVKRHGLNALYKIDLVVYGDDEEYNINFENITVDSPMQYENYILKEGFYLKLNPFSISKISLKKSNFINFLNFKSSLLLNLKIETKNKEYNEFMHEFREEALKEKEIQILGLNGDKPVKIKFKIDEEKLKFYKTGILVELVDKNHFKDGKDFCEKKIKEMVFNIVKGVWRKSNVFRVESKLGVDDVEFEKEFNGISREHLRMEAIKKWMYVSTWLVLSSTMLLVVSF